MEFGAHLPLMPMSPGPSSPTALRDDAAAAAGLGYRWLAANDHLVFARPWIDGPTALASVIDASGDLGLATTVCLPAVRGPAATAKAFAAPLTGRSTETLAALALPIGPADRCAERIAAFRDAVAQRLFIWPLGDEVAQLERFAVRVIPLVTAVGG